MYIENQLESKSGGYFSIPTGQGTTSSAADASHRMFPHLRYRPTGLYGCLFEKYQHLYMELDD